jgi:hypothetical protein
MRTQVISHPPVPHRKRAIAPAIAVVLIDGRGCFGPRNEIGSPFSGTSSTPTIRNSTTHPRLLGLWRRVPI